MAARRAKQAKKKEEEQRSADSADRDFKLSADQTDSKSFTQWFKRLAYSHSLYQWTLQGNVPDQLAVIPSDPWPGNFERGRYLSEGKISFGGVMTSADPHLWPDDGLDDEAWLFWAHGFGWLRDLRSMGGNRARMTARDMTLKWIESHDNWDPKVWRPDILGKRLSALLGMHDFFIASASDDFRRHIFDMIRRQGCHLIRVLPKSDLVGPADLTALRAMVHISLAFEDFNNRLPEAIEMIESSVRSQIAPDGAHRSRNPSDGVRTLRTLLDIRYALRAGGKSVPDTLNRAIPAVASAMEFFRHGDRTLALFHGSEIGSETEMDLIHNNCPTKGRRLRSLPHSGFERLTGGRTLVLFDSGLVPQHPYDKETHASPLAFEMSHGDERIIVNCGRYSQQPDPNGYLGFALRGTSAHSTVTINDTNSYELSPRGVLSRRPTRCGLERERDTMGLRVSGEHDGYTGKFGLVHKRELFLSGDGQVLRGVDRLEGEEGHEAVIRFHLHPDCQALVTGEGASILVRTKRKRGWRFKAEGHTVALEESLYAGGLQSESRKTQQIVIRLTTASGQTKVAWQIKREQTQ